MPIYAKSLYENHWRTVDRCVGERHTASPRSLQLYLFHSLGRPMQATLGASIESRCRCPGLPTVTPIQYPLAPSTHIGFINPLSNDLRHFESSEQCCDGKDWDQGASFQNGLRPRVTLVGTLSSTTTSRFTRPLGHSDVQTEILLPWRPQRLSAFVPSAFPSVLIRPREQFDLLCPALRLPIFYRRIPKRCSRSQSVNAESRPASDAHSRPSQYSGLPWSARSCARSGIGTTHILVATLLFIGPSGMVSWLNTGLSVTAAKP